MDLNDSPLDERPLAFDAPGWLYEIKLYGYGLTALFGYGDCGLLSRGRADATQCFPEMWKSLAAGSGGPHIVDGEVCFFDDLSRSDFDCLQDCARLRRWYEGADPVGFAIFDVTMLNGGNVF